MTMRECEPLCQSDRDEELRKGPPHSFDEWHQRTKLTVMRRLFESYLGSGCRFMDVACGDGDVYVALAKRFTCSCSDEIGDAECSDL